jgi:hypothetical protein
MTDVMQCVRCGSIFGYPVAKVWIDSGVCQDLGNGKISCCVNCTSSSEAMHNRLQSKGALGVAGHNAKGCFDGCLGCMSCVAIVISGVILFAYSIT